MPTADDCARRIRELFDADLEEPAGVLHPLAVWQPPEGAAPFALRTGTKQTPKSDADRFVLGVARARADAVLTTGRNLRLEPRLTHALWPRRRGGGWDAALAAWRRERLGRPEPRWSLVLTRRGDLDLDHPIFRGPTRGVLFTDESAGRELAPWARRVGVEMVTHPSPGPREALAWLRAQGALGVAVEAGPTTALALYDAPLAVDELILSHFDEPALAVEAQGPAFLEPSRLEALLRPAGAPHSAVEPSGRWSFRRWLRREAGDEREE